MGVAQSVGGVQAAVVQVVVQVGVVLVLVVVAARHHSERCTQKDLGGSERRRRQRLVQKKARRRRYASRRARHRLRVGPDVSCRWGPMGCGMGTQGRLRWDLQVAFEIRIWRPKPEISPLGLSLGLRQFAASHA